jgi:hypothetical protein
VVRFELIRRLGSIGTFTIEEPVDIRDALEWFLKHNRDIPAERN